MITNSRIALGDRLGAQMNTLAELVFLAHENQQELVLYDELRQFRRGYEFLEVFDVERRIRLINQSGKLKNHMIRLYCRQFSRQSKSVGNWKRIYQSRLSNQVDRLVYKWITLSYPSFNRINKKVNQIHCDESLLQLSHGNFDISSGLGTYQDWKKYGDEMMSLFSFKPEIEEAGQKSLSEIQKKSHDLTENPLLVSIHIRLGDYLILSSLNLDASYYQKAIQYFDASNTVFIIFSDEIEKCREMIQPLGIKSIYVEGNSAAVDMYLMSRCDSNIIANSTYSFWGAFLNPNPEKKVICPHDFIGQSSKENLYINGNYYPDDWIAI